MKFLGLLRTHGTPVCIARSDSLADWDGWDPHLLEGDELVSTVVAGDGARFALMRPASDRVAVFADHEGFALLEDPYGGEDYNLHDALFALESLEIEPDVLRLARFGGPVALFPAEVPGRSIPSPGPSALGTSPATIADAAWLQLIEGYWTVSQFTFEDERLAVRGVWFEAVEAQPAR
ncbi:MAG: hypothetical protein KatS3mg108_3174 [Isosphaeraceae bacterium]|nr:MAG: hypothetical protein KatS3mg108_3174 [Isosphaeraceae bacterium]